MKLKRCLILVIILFVSVSTFTFGQSGKIINITGIDAEFHGVFTSSLCNNVNNPWGSAIHVGASWTSDIYDFSNGNFVSGLHYTNDGTSNYWRDSGSYYFVINLYGPDGFLYTYITKNRIDFNNIITTIPFSDFNFISRQPGQ